jgi:hypothetical protein
LFDVSVNSITGNVSGGSSNTTHIAFQDGDNFSSSNTSYVGSKFRITTGLGLTETSRTIISYDGVSKTAEITPPLTVAANGQSLFSIDFEIKDIESLANFSSNTLVAGSNISTRSKDLATPFQDVIITDALAEPMIFKLGENYVSSNSISDMSFSYRRLYQNQSFSSSLSPSLSLGSGESLTSGTTSTSRAINYYLSVTTQGTSPYTPGSIIPSDKFTVDTGLNRITVASGNNMVANIIATIDVSTATRKNKTFVTGNTIVQIASGVDVFSNTAVISYPANGQCHIDSSFIEKTPGTVQSLFVSDVYSINKILLI